MMSHKISKYGPFILVAILTLLALLLSSCEKQCLYYSCEQISESGEVTYVTVNGSNATVIGLSRCNCIDEVNRYVR